LALLGIAAVTRLARPGIRLGFAPAGVGTVVMVMWVFAVTVLIRAPAQNRSHLLFGTSAAVCPLLIALVAVPPFIANPPVPVGLAPTRLRMAGAAAGFAAGSLGALACSFALSETRGAVSRYLVPARHVDTDVTRGVARSAPDALVARPLGSDLAVTFCVLRAN
jgi:hypothetical protein